MTFKHKNIIDFAAGVSISMHKYFADLYSVCGSFYAFFMSGLSMAFNETLVLNSQSKNV